MAGFFLLWKLFLYILMKYGIMVLRKTYFQRFFGIPIIKCEVRTMEALALKNEAVNLIEKLPVNKIRYVIQFTQFISQQNFFEEEQSNPAPSKHLPLGFLKGKAKVHFADNWEISPEELLGL
jgi:hypothetical protein